MSSSRATTASRFTDVLFASLQAALQPSDGMTTPAAVLWADADGQWAELVARMRGECPFLFTLGEYNPDRRTGPAIWLRCIVDRTLPDAWPFGAPTPVLYLPRVERQLLRAGGDCPVELQPLVELQFRGTVWHQRNGRDWTVDAFAGSSDGCALEMAKDQLTRAALMRVLPRLADVPLDALRGRRLAADDFDKLAVPDPQRDLLVWMHDAPAFRAAHSAADWTAFRNLVVAGYGVDPEDDGVNHAAARLLDGHGQWAELWQRFCEAPERYRGISTVLRQPLPGQGMLLVDRARQPLMNDEEERRLRDALVAVSSMSHAEACDRVLELEAEHGSRRSWVWRYLGESPYAEALEPLARLADCARKGLHGTRVEDLASAYANDGWRCDEAALAALTSTQGPTQRDLIASVVRALYLTWLDRSARQFQTAVNASGGRLPAGATSSVDAGTCLVFADGLRFDLATRLQGALEGRAITVRLSHRIGPVPTVTATAKPLATSVADMLEGADAADFNPRFRDNKQAVVAAKLRVRMSAQGVEVLSADEIRMPASETATGWIEVGRIDELGHKLGDGLAQQIDHELERLKETVTALLDAGWRRVRVVTDHGWLLMPGGLPKIDLPQYLVASRWARCASVREGATPQVETYPWYWNDSVRIACPPGAGAYAAGTTYAHGGISPQECVVPELICERGAAVLSASITKVEWKRLRCVVSVTTNDQSVRVDVRSNWKLPTTSLVVAPKLVGDEGHASLAVRDEFEGQAVSVIVMDSNGQVLDKRSTIVGGE